MYLSTTSGWTASHLGSSPRQSTVTPLSFPSLVAPCGPRRGREGGCFALGEFAVSARRIHLKLAYIAVARSPQRHSPFFPSLPAGHGDHECRAALGGLSLFQWCDSCRRAREVCTLSTSTRTRIHTRARAHGHPHTHTAHDTRTRTHTRH